MSSSQPKPQSKLRPGSIGSAILTWVGILTIVIGIISVLNAAFNWNLIIEVSGTDVELPDDIEGSLMLLVIGVIFLIIGLVIGNTKVQTVLKRYKWLPWTILLAFIGLAVLGIYQLNIMSMGGPVFAAAQQNELGTIQSAFENGNPSESKEHLLGRAIYYESYDVAHYLLDQGANTDGQDEWGEPLIFRALRSNESIIRRFIENETNFMVEDASGNTAIDLFLSTYVLNDNERQELSILLQNQGYEIGSEATTGESSPSTGSSKTVTKKK